MTIIEITPMFGRIIQEGFQRELEDSSIQIKNAKFGDVVIVETVNPLGQGAQDKIKNMFEGLANVRFT